MVAQLAPRTTQSIGATRHIIEQLLRLHCTMMDLPLGDGEPTTSAACFFSSSCTCAQASTTCSMSHRCSNTIVRAETTKGVLDVSAHATLRVSPRCPLPATSCAIHYFFCFFFVFFLHLRARLRRACQTPRSMLCTFAIPSGMMFGRGATLRAARRSAHAPGTSHLSYTSARGIRLLLRGRRCQCSPPQSPTWAAMAASAC